MSNIYNVLIIKDRKIVAQQIKVTCELQKLVDNKLQKKLRYSPFLNHIFLKKKIIVINPDRIQ